MERGIFYGISMDFWRVDDFTICLFRMESENTQTNSGNNTGIHEKDCIYLISTISGHYTILL